MSVGTAGEEDIPYKCPARPGGDRVNGPGITGLFTGCSKKIESGLSS